MVTLGFAKTAQPNLHLNKHHVKVGGCANANMLPFGIAQDKPNLLSKREVVRGRSLSGVEGFPVLNLEVLFCV